MQPAGRIPPGATPGKTGRCALSASRPLCRGASLSTHITVVHAHHRHRAQPPRAARRPAYFACMDLMYFVRFAIRKSTIAWFWSIVEKSGPHTGISASPCAGAFAPLRSTFAT